MLKSVGYLVSAVSVLLLGAVSWKGVERHPLMQACLVAGMAASLIGMFCRWLSYQREK